MVDPVLFAEPRKWKNIVLWIPTSVIQECMTSLKTSAAGISGLLSSSSNSLLITFTSHFQNHNPILLREISNFSHYRRQTNFKFKFKIQKVESNLRDVLKNRLSGTMTIWLNHDSSEEGLQTIRRSYVSSTLYVLQFNCETQIDDDYISNSRQALIFKLNRFEKHVAFVWPWDSKPL